MRNIYTAQNDYIRFRINSTKVEKLNKRAKKLKLSLSTYLRLLIHMDERFKTFETLMTATKVDAKFLKLVDKKILLNDMRTKKKKK